MATGGTGPQPYAIVGRGVEAFLFGAFGSFDQPPDFPSAGVAPGQPVVILPTKIDLFAFYRCAKLSRELAP